MFWDRLPVMAQVDSGALGIGAKIGLCLQYQSRHAEDGRNVAL